MSNIKLKSFPCPLKRFCLSNRLFSNSSALRQHILASHKGKSVPAARTWVRLQSASAPEDQFRPTQDTQPTLNSQLTQDAQPTQGSQSTQSIHSSQDSQSFQSDSYLDDLEPHYTNGNEQSQEPDVPLETEAPDLVNVTNNRRTTQHNLKELREEKIGGDIWSEPGDTGSWPQAVDVPDIDLMLAEFALDCNLSNANYTRLVSIVKLAQQTAITSPLKALVRYTTIESVFKNIKKNQESYVTLPFTTERLNLDDMPELASDKERLATIVGEPMLIYRNIRHLSERLLSHPLFEGVTHVQPSILRDSDEH